MRELEQENGKLKRLIAAAHLDISSLKGDFGMGGDYVTRLLDRAALFGGYPKELRTGTDRNLLAGRS